MMFGQDINLNDLTFPSHYRLAGARNRHAGEGAR